MSAEAKDDSDDLSVGLKKVSFAESTPSSPLPPPTNPTTVAASTSAPPPPSSADKGWPDQDTPGIQYGSLTPLSPIVMHRQATINIGTIGHVAHGKSTVVKAISGVQTVRFKTELERNITIKLGYANAKIYRCDNTKCPRPGNYKSYGSAMEASPACDRPGCGGRMILQRHVSFVDCFGVDTEVVMMEGGHRRVDGLKVGDELLGVDGTARTVQSIVSGEKTLYKVAYTSIREKAVEVESFTCTGGHLLVLRIDHPVDRPALDQGKGRYYVRVLWGDTEGIGSSVYWFTAYEEAQAFYNSANRSPIVFDLTVEAYLEAPLIVRNKSRLFRSERLDIPIAPLRPRGVKGQRGGDSSLAFTVEQLGVGPFVGFETNGDQRILLRGDVVAHNCPGHDILMATMLNGAAVMDAAMLLIAGNETCWPVDDTRILTDRGYLFLEDIKELEQRGEQPLFACYDTKSASLVFRPRIGRLVHYEHHGPIVDFTHTAERARWAADSTRFGASSHGQSTVHTGGHFTLRVTPEHAVFTQHGEWQGNNQWRWSAFGAGQAGTAAPTQSSTAIRMLTRAAGGLGTSESDESAVERELLAMFGVSGTAACDAFLELYGFWLGDGSLDVHNQRVIFINFKESDVTWLRTTLPKTGLPADEWYENPQRATGVRFAIGPWYAPFFDEYGDKHVKAAREYSDERFVADVDPVATPYHKAPKKSCVCLWCDVHLSNSPSGRCKHRAKCKVDLRMEEDKENAPTASETEDEDEDEDMSDRPSTSSSPAPVCIEAPNVASAKWFWYWLKKASRRQLRLVVAGLHRADGSFSSQRGEVYTSSVRFRDELLAVLASAGYTASFSLKRPAGAVSCHMRKKHAPATIKRTLTPQAFALLPGDQQLLYYAIKAKSCSWRVQFNEYEAVALRQEDIQSLPFKGAVWCLTVDHPDHLVVVQRAHRVQEDGKWIVTKAGAAIIVGQCPQPQTSEHLAAVEIMKLKHLLILQNKIDLVKEKEAASQYDEILNFIRGTVADGSPIIPISAQLKYNIEVVCIAEGTPVNLAQGVSVPIEQVRKGDRVLALREGEEGEGGLASSRVTAVLERGVKRCVELQFSDGRTLTCTPDHRIRAADGRWVEAQHLSIDESSVAVGVEYPLVSAEPLSRWSLNVDGLGYPLDVVDHRRQTMAFARVLGYLMSDAAACVKPQHVTVAHHLDAQAVCDDVDVLTGSRPSAVRSHGKLRVALPRTLLTACSSVGVHAGDHTNEVCEVPAFLQAEECPLSVVREYVGGLFGGNSRTVWGEKERVSEFREVEWSCAKLDSVIPRQMEVIQQRLYPLLSRCGVNPHHLTLDVTDNTVDVCPGAAKGETTRKLNLRLVDSVVSSFHSGVGLRYHCHEQQLLTTAAMHLRTPTTSDLFTPASSKGVPSHARLLPLSQVRLVSRRDVGMKRVYDLTVPHGTSFTANGVVVHNCEYICKKIPVPVRDFAASPQLIVIRSFDVNKPGEEVDNLKGGVAGGSILKGVLRIGQDIEIRPGIVTKDRTGGVRCLPIKSKIVSLYAEHNDLSFAVPGGLIGVGTKIDPTLTRADRLVGQVLGDVGALPDIFTELEISFFLLRRLLGVKTDGEKKKQEKIKKLAKGEILMVNIGSTSTGARILQVKGDLAKVVLTSPVCTQEGEKLALSRRVEKHWRLIGWGKIRKGTRIVQSEGTGGSSGVTGLGATVGRGFGEEGEDEDEMDALSKEADQAGQQIGEDEEEEEEKE